MVLDTPVSEQVFPRVVVVSDDRVFVMTEPNNYVVTPDLLVRRVPGPNWFSPFAAVRSDAGVAVIYRREPGDSVGIVDPEGAFTWQTTLAIIASPGVLFRGVTNPTVLWTSGGDTFLSEFDSTGTDVLARPVTLPANAVASGYGAQGDSGLLAPAYVGLDDPCAVMIIDPATGGTVLGPPLAPEHRRSSCELFGAPGGYTMEWVARDADTRLFAAVSDAGVGGTVLRNAMPDGGPSHVAGSDTVGTAASLLSFLSTEDLQQPPVFKRIAVGAGEEVYESALGSDGTDAYVAFRVVSPGGEQVRLQKLSHVHR